MSHTILLVQPGTRPETRTYSDYESVNECMEGVCKIYEEHLKRRNPNTPTITYDISQLFDFLDQVNFADLFSFPCKMIALVHLSSAEYRMKENMVGVGGVDVFSFNHMVERWLLLANLIRVVVVVVSTHFTVGRFKLLGLSKVDKHIRTVQQRMDQRKDLCAVATSGRHHGWTIRIIGTLKIEISPYNSIFQIHKTKLFIKQEFAGDFGRKRWKKRASSSHSIFCCWWFFSFSDRIIIK